MSGFTSDLRLGVRLLAKSPVFTITAALLLAVGISANTLIFSAVNALLLRPLPVSHPENLVRLVEVHPNDFVTWSLPYGFCDAAAARDADFSEVICQGEADVAFHSGTLEGLAPERVRVHLVSPNFFSSLGVHAWLGRELTAADERTAATNAVVSYAFWRTKLLGDAAVLGRSITLGGYPFRIVGVAPEGFNGLAADTSPDVRVPAAVDRYLVKPEGEMNPAARALFAEVFGRLRAGVPLERANKNADWLLNAILQDETERIFPPAARTTRTKGPLDSHLRLESIATGVSTLRAQFSRGLQVLMAGVALLLLMACANVAGLLLARSAGRAPEMGIRLALGARAGRIVRQLLTEGLLLALLGGIGAMVLTKACLPLLVRGLPPIRDRAAVLQPLAVHIAIDLRVAAFATAVTALTALLFSLSPALRCAHFSLVDALRGTRTATRRSPARNLIVIAQVALGALILMGAALLSATLEHMRSMNAGFDRDRVATLTLYPTLSGYTAEQSRAFSLRLLDKARTLPGVSAASIAGRALMRGTGEKATLGAAGERIGAGDFLNSSLNEVTPGYFETMGIRLLAGRTFNWFDRNRSTQRQAIVNQAFATRFFAGKNAIGERFGFPGPGGVAAGDNVIIGVVSDAKYRSLREQTPPTAYSPVVDGFDSAFVLHLRTGQRPEAMLAPVRELLRSLDPGLPAIEVHTMREEVEASLWQERLLAALSTLFAVIAALLASIGLYGALDYAVKSRTREIGLRMALGAHPARIVGVFSRDALLLTAAGLVVGFAAYSLAAGWMRRILYDLRPWEPEAVLFVVSLVVLIAILAAAPAVYRAVRIDPAAALRSE